MTKRRRLVLASIFLTGCFLATQLLDISLRYWAILIFGILTYFLTALILKQDFKKIGWLVVLTPSFLYVITASLFYFLLPTGVLSRLLISLFFGISIYAILLTENIFSIASSFHTIQLLRAAQAVGFLLTLVTAFFGFSTIFSYKLSPWFNGILVFVFTSFLIISSLWSINLEEKINYKIVIYSLTLAYILAEFTYMISFWPLTITSASLFIISCLYVILGIFQSFIGGRLFKNTLREFLQIGFIIFIITLFLAHWR